ncbi:MULTISPECIES: hypothetical protein [Pseudomonas]|uniref:phage tail terminator protein n=1 Tax=Pseudomonas guariconensis TaxID=1288410 RepID=UPI002098101F|nr:MULTISPECIES: hypothetical protein [Pseudomonas]MCO7594269.1 hypothetical protein [Pseudomonas guariconensis]MCU7220004.1 hypothetical protein [Pseudomonas brassicacearum]
MRLSPLIEHLKRHCPSLGGRVAGGIDMDAVMASAKMVTPACYVICTGDEAGENLAQNKARQTLVDQFDVVLVLQTRDERGQQAVDVLHDLRAELFRALVGLESDDHEPITYVGGSLMVIDRAKVVYRYGFEAESQIGRSRAGDPAETWQEYKLDGLPPLRGIDFNFDSLDPKDPNHTAPGPDGRVEVRFSTELSQE